MVENLVLKKLFSSESDEQRAALVNDLRQLTPRSLKLMAAIYQHGNPALQERAIGRYQSSTSVNILVRDEHDMIDLYERTKKEDLQIVEFFSKRSGTFVQNLDLDSCPAAITDGLRAFNLGMELVTPSMPPISHQVRMMRWTDVPVDTTPRTIRVEVAPSIVKYLNSRGPYKSYLGSDTKVKQPKGPLEVICPDNTEQSALKLAQMASWVGGDQNLQELLQRLISEKTTSPVDRVLAASSKVVSGIVEHRGEVMTVPKGSYINYDPNITSHMNITTDSATAFARKAADYTLVFQCKSVHWQLHHPPASGRTGRRRRLGSCYCLSLLHPTSI
ncbi:RNA-directed RNA polymerase L [Chionoecetes opilio]|uniref:RNA-directed RNA polymerase L n=1 Tax=Chionoecetes opilio TaxID=41210 RepID=A0A8J4Y0J8_CHIOP|nr:RNA-directed RNA polymerase L [Chionoecetes opilio]